MKRLIVNYNLEISEVYALLAGSAVFGVITIVLVFASCFLFVAGYFQDSES